PPCQGAATPTADTAAPCKRRAASLAGISLQVVVPTSGCRPYELAAADRAHWRLLPLRVGPSSIQLPPCMGPWLPLQGAWPWPATPARGLPMASHPCKWHGRGWPPFLAAFIVKTQQECVE
ncbi:hypothetical protein BHE74_00058077, partial [Ensete ventricosum]